jgi:hypothetical protein
VSNFTGAWNSVTYGYAGFVGVTDSNAAYSTDGITWTEVSVAGGSWNKVVWTSSPGVKVVRFN